MKPRKRHGAPFDDQTLKTMTPPLLIGDHPLLDSIRAGERLAGWPERIDPSVRHCMVAFRKEGDDGFAQDSEAFARLKSLTEGREGSLLLEILVHDPVSVALFENSDLPHVECMPFTVESRWAESLFGPGGLVHLDGDGISFTDDRKVHLVLFGMTPAAEALAVETLKTAHFPNYIRDHSLRTRITWISPAAPAFGARFTNRYKSLMDASFYRFVDLEKEEVSLHSPDHDGRIEDFVDIEWEFVRATGLEELVRSKLRHWTDPASGWRTVVAFAFPEDGRNIEYCQSLRNELGDAPVLVHVGNDALVRAAGLQVIPFGMPWSCIRNTLLDRRIAMAVNAVYELTSRDKHFPIELDMAEAERLWAGLSGRYRRASLDNGRSLGCKMRSIGLQEEDWKVLYGIDADSEEQLSEVEHNRWSVATLLSGMRPATAEEQAAVEKDIKLKRTLKAQGVHYDLRAYSDLRADEMGNDTRLYDMALTKCLPLIAHAATVGEDGTDA